MVSRIAFRNAFAVAVFIPMWAAVGIAFGIVVSLGVLLTRYVGPVLYRAILDRPSVRSVVISLLCGMAVTSLIAFVIIFRLAMRFLRRPDRVDGIVGLRPSHPESSECGSLSARGAWRFPEPMLSIYWGLVGASVPIILGTDLVSRFIDEPSFVQGIWQGRFGRGDPFVILVSLPAFILGVVTAIPLAGLLWQWIAVKWFHLTDDDIQMLIRIERR